MSGPGALCRDPALSPGALCVGARRSLCRGPGPATLSLFVLGPSTLCGCLCPGPGAVIVGPQRSLCRGPALSASGPGTLCVLRRSVSGPGVFPPLCVSGPGGLCVEARQSLCRAPSSSAGPPPRSDPRATHPPAQTPSSDPSACHRGLSSSKAQIRVPLMRVSQGPSSDPRATHPAREHPSPQLRSVCVPPIRCGPQLRSSRSLFPGENPKHYCLGEYRNYTNINTNIHINVNIL